MIFADPIKLKRLHKDAKIPTYATEGSACLDLYAVEDVSFRKGDVKSIRSGWAIEIPYGCYGEIVPRSGIATKQELIILNSPCIIDSDYRGEIITYMKCIADIPEIWYTIIKKGDRYAQMFIHEYIKAAFKEVPELSETERDTGGFGSTGR